MMGPQNPVAAAMNGGATAVERPTQIAAVAPPAPAHGVNPGAVAPQRAQPAPVQQAQTQQAYAPQQPQQPYQPSFQDMMRFFQMMQQQGYAPQQPQYQPQPMPQGAQARMQMQQQNPFARAPQPAQAYAPQAPAAVAQPVSAMPTRAPVNPQQAVGATAVENPNPVHQAMQGAAVGGAGLAMSDETQKVVSEPSLADAFLEHMKPYSYKYKDPRMEPRVQPTGGTYLGVMAQDLERIPHLGAQLVVHTPHGKMVDQKTALSATMAGLARVFERVKALEADALKGRK